MPQTPEVRTLVAADVVSSVPAKYEIGSRVVRTPLDLVRALDERFDRVVLIGAFARDRAYVRFIREMCQSIDLILTGDRADAVQPRAVFV